jgi:hypothetical protein
MAKGENDTLWFNSEGQSVGYEGRPRSFTLWSADDISIQYARLHSKDIQSNNNNNVRYP